MALVGIKYDVSVSAAVPSRVVLRRKDKQPMRWDNKPSSYFMTADQADLLLRLAAWTNAFGPNIPGSHTFVIPKRDHKDFDSLLGRRFVRLTSDKGWWPERRSDALELGLWELTNLGKNVAKHLEACSDLLATVGAGPKTWPKECGAEPLEVSVSEETKVEAKPKAPKWTAQDQKLLDALVARRELAMQERHERLYTVLNEFHYREMRTDELTNELLKHASVVGPLLVELSEGVQP